MPSILLVCLVAYLIGSIPFGWLIARLRGVDIFAAGSGNIGATNVARVLGKPLGILVFVLDFAKGAGPVLLAQKLYGSITTEPVPGPPYLLEVGAGLSAFLGHLFPVYLRFRGGKGVATAAGVVSVLYPLPALAGLLAFASVASATRYVSLGSLAAAVTLVVTYLLRAGRFDVGDPLTIFALVALTMIFVRHRGNIERLRQGTEAKIGTHRLLEGTVRSLHVLSLGIWCGTTIFFSFVAAPALFREFEEAGAKPADKRPAWFPLPARFQLHDDAIDGPKEQGTRAAGYAVSAVFPSYYLTQLLCGVVAFGTALGWPKRRPWIVGAALLLTIAGWLYQPTVLEARQMRNETVDKYLQGEEKVPAAAGNAKFSFFLIHLVSLGLNVGVIVLVVIATAKAGNLPTREATNASTV